MILSEEGRKMSISRAKKKRKNKPQLKPFEIVMMSNYLNMAIVVRTMWTVYGWKNRRIAGFIESYLSIMQEVADGRRTVKDEVDDCLQLTGINVKKLIDELYADRQRNK